MQLKEKWLKLIIMQRNITFKAAYEKTSEHMYTHILNLHSLSVISSLDYDTKLK